MHVDSPGSSQMLLLPTETHVWLAGQSRVALHASWQSENTQMSGELQSRLRLQPLASPTAEGLLLQLGPPASSASVTGRPNTTLMTTGREAPACGCARPVLRDDAP